MSITDEKWTCSTPPELIRDRAGRAVCMVQNDGDYELEVDTARAQAIAVLPEALALLKQQYESDCPGDENSWSPAMRDEVELVLKRAGVLK